MRPKHAANILAYKQQRLLSVVKTLKSVGKPVSNGIRAEIAALSVAIGAVLSKDTSQDALEAVRHEGKALIAQAMGE